MKAEMSADDDEWAPAERVPRAGGRKGKKQKIEEDCGKPAPGVEEGIEVKTKFPVARIKRIMQADEDVGKVAQVTPTAVCEFVQSSSRDHMIIDFCAHSAHTDRVLFFSESVRTVHDFSRDEIGSGSKIKRLKASNSSTPEASSGEGRTTRFLG